MENTSWLKQAPDKPLFEKLLWNKPETKTRAGKLLIVGGNLHGFSAPATAYSTALKAGVGSVRAVMPSAAKKFVGEIFPEVEFAPSTMSGSFSKKALGELLEAADWADAVLLAGDFGRNSETAILLESFINKHKGTLVISGDGLDYFLNTSNLMERPMSTMVINIGKLQKLAKTNRPRTPVLHSMNLHELVSLLIDWTAASEVNFVTKHSQKLLVASRGRVSSTPQPEESSWQIILPAFAAVWLLQQPSSNFEALTSAVYEYINM